MEGMGVMHAIIGDDPEAAEWMEEPSKSCVAIATDGTVNVTSAEDLTLLSFWFATAANWLKTHGG
jgi:hypothetical protein